MASLLTALASGAESSDLLLVHAEGNLLRG